MRGGVGGLFLRVRNELAICFSWFWYHWKEEVHAVLFSYSTSKFIYGALRYPHLTLEKLENFELIYIEFPYFHRPPPLMKRFQ